MDVSSTLCRTYGCTSHCVSPLKCLAANNACACFASTFGRRELAPTGCQCERVLFFSIARCGNYIRADRRCTLLRPEYFKSHGMLTLGSGKLFHPGVPPNNDYPLSWSTSEPYYSPECMPPKCPDSVAPGGNIQKSGASGYYSCVSQDPEQGGYTLCAANTSKDETRFDYQLEDQRIRDSALGHLELAAQRLNSDDSNVEGKKGFFIGAGFHKVGVGQSRSRPL